MSRQPTITEVQLENLAACLATTVPVLNELDNAFGSPFILPISNTIGALINLLQNVKQNKKECARLAENIYKVLYGIINLHITSEPAGSLSPAMINDVGRFMKTLHKIRTYIEAQQDSNKIKQLFRHLEMSSLVKDCHTELDQAMKVFMVANGDAVFKDIEEIKHSAEVKHKELLDLISTLSATTTTSDSSSAQLGAGELKNSSNSFSLLPSSPKIFHGRETEVENIMKMLLDPQAPRIAILGGGGMGKTSVARAVLHHPDTLTRFEERFFVSAEPATTSVELAALIGLHIGLKPGKDLTKAVVQFFSKRSSCLLILDNLETVWEPVQSRGRVEEFLSLLTDVKDLALIITMRGTERPAQVQWTHPFLKPLQRLSDNAAQQTIIDITDNYYDIQDLTELLAFMDNMPLAVELIAHLVDHEGLENVMAQWKKEKTSMLSVGHDRKSNLGASINLSLSSSRVTPDSKRLLSLLSILPNGLSDTELMQSKLPISNILSCKAVLLATSLAYQNSNRRLMLLVPVREHIQQWLPPSPLLICSLRTHFHALLELYQKYRGVQMGSIITQITLNLGNLQEVLGRGLHVSDPGLADTIHCSISLSSFYRLTIRGVAPLIDNILHILPRISDNQLKIYFIIEVLKSNRYPKAQMEKLIAQGISHFEHVHDFLLESKFYYALATFADYILDFQCALQSINKAQELSRSSNDSSHQYRVLLWAAQLYIRVGDYSTGYEYTREAQQLSELSMDLYHSAIALSLQSDCSSHHGAYRKSMAQLYKAKAMLEICGMSRGAAFHQIITNEAQIHIVKSEYIQARSIYSDIAKTSSPGQNALAYALALLNITYIDTQIDAPAANVWKNLGIAAEVYKSLNIAFGITLCKVFEADLDLRNRRFHSAQMKLQECLHSELANIKSECLELLANINAWPTSEGQSRWPIIYLSFAYKIKEKLALHKALLFLGDVFMAEKDENTASTLYTVALEGFTYMDVHRSRAQCMVRLGDLAQSHGYTTAAIAHWSRAQLLFKQSSLAKNVAEIDSKLATTVKDHEEALVTLARLQAPTESLEKLFTSQEQPVKLAS